MFYDFCECQSNKNAVTMVETLAVRPEGVTAFVEISSQHLRFLPYHSQGEGKGRRNLRGEDKV